VYYQQYVKNPHLRILPVTSADFIGKNYPHFTRVSIRMSAFYHWPSRAVFLNHCYSWYFLPCYSTWLLHVHVAYSHFKICNIGVPLVFRTDRNLFDLCKLQSESKTTSALVRELLFADDCALAAHTLQEA